MKVHFLYCDFGDIRLSLYLDVRYLSIF